MRWKAPEDHKRRVRKGFLFRPRQIEGEKRWLEFATWMQKYNGFSTFGWWEDEEWVNREWV